MRRYLFAALIVMFFCQSVSAQNFETLWTKDGNIYEGYMSEQIPGRQVTFYAIRATLSVRTEDIQERHEVFRELSTFEKDNQEWLSERIDTNDLVLSSIYANGIYYDDVYVVDESRTSIQFVLLRRSSYVIEWNQIDRKYIKPEDVTDHGIYDAVLLSDNRRYVGHIDKQYITANKMVMTLQDGNIQEFSLSDVFSTSVEPISKEMSIWSQCRLLDRIFLKDNRVLEGLILARKNGDFIQFIQKEDEEPQKISMSDIVKYQKYLNRDYVAQDEQLD